MTPEEATQIQSDKDTVVTFGKHKGKKMGSLPSAYLYWMAVEFEEPWASIADRVWRWRDKVMCHRGIPKWACHRDV